ncbi:MAG: nicotinamide-nucleotide adenylyltransferase [Promethearchaeota archaeon]
MIKVKSEDEILACINDENVKYLHSGQISKYIFPMKRKLAHKKKITHLIVRIFIMAITPDNKILYLVQKRSKNKKGYPKYFTDSASGHVLYDNNLELECIRKNALRELEEEFGIHPKAIKKNIFHSLEVEKDNFTKEIAYVFLGLVNYDVNLHPNPNELDVKGSRFYTESELKEILKNEKVVHYSKKIWGKLLLSNIKSLFFKEKGDIKKDIALFIGRFQPFHLGHLLLIEKILKTFKKLKIGIGSAQLSHTENDPFTSEERKQFIISTLQSKQISKEKYEIIEIPDIFNSEKWIAHVQSLVGEFNVLFSNSDWVRNLAQNEGIIVANKEFFDKEKYNGTNIRNLIKKGNNLWKNLVPKEVVKKIIELDGINRIKQLSTISIHESGK